MVVYLNKSQDLKQYNGAVVYLKADKTPYIQLDGGNLEVNTNDDTVTVKTSKEFAVFNQSDILALRFL